MEKHLIEKIILEKNFIQKYGFKFNLNESGINPLGYEFLGFISNISNQRRLYVYVSFFPKDNKYLYFLNVNIEKITDKIGEDEDLSFNLRSRLEEKKIDYDKNKFVIYPEDGMALEQQFLELLEYIESLFEIEELNKIIKGEYWEFRTTDWGMFGK